MLKGIRGALGSILASILMVLLLVSFAIWGVGDIFRARSLSVAEIGETEITLQTMLRDFNNRVRSLRTQLGELSDAEAIGFGLHQQVLNELVARNVLDEDARQQGLRANNAQARAEIREIEAFEGLLGGFDTTAYSSALRQAGFADEEEFEALVRRDITRQQLMNALVTVMPVPSFYVDTLYVHRKETRTADILTVPASAVNGIDNPDGETLRAFHETVARQYMTPEFRTFRYVTLETSDFAADLEITEDVLRQEYDARIDEYQVPDARTIEAVHFQDEAETREFEARIAAGESFVDAAIEMTDFTEEELKLGEFDRFRLGAEYNEVASDRVFALGLGEVTEPVASLFGWDVFRVSAITAGSVQPFEDVREVLMRELTSDRGTDSLYDLAGRIDDELASGKLLEEVAEVLGLDVHHVAGADRNGVGTNGLPVNSRNLAIVLAPAFAAETDAEAILEENDEGIFFAVEVASITPAEPMAFEDVQDNVRTSWITEERLKVARIRADEALARAQSGEGFAALVDSYNGNTFSAPALQRDNQRGQGGISTAVSNLIFSLPDGGVGMEQAASGDGYILARVTGITPGVADRDSEEYKNLVLRMQNEFSGDAAAQYQAAAFAAIPPIINYELMTTTFTEDGIMLPTTNAGPGLQ